MKKNNKRITPAMLQGMFLDFARELCVEELGSVKNCPSYEGRPEDVYEGYRCWFDAQSDWTQNIEAGNLLRVLKFVGAYDGRLFRLTLNHRSGAREPPFRKIRNHRSVRTELLHRNHQNLHNAEVHGNKAYNYGKVYKTA